MNNKEKAEEICKRHIFDSSHFDCCIEMAEWKDRQINLILEIVSPMIFGGHKYQIEDILETNIDWKKFKK